LKQIPEHFPPIFFLEPSFFDPGFSLLDGACQGHCPREVLFDLLTFWSPYTFSIKYLGPCSFLSPLDAVQLPEGHRYQVTIIHVSSSENFRFSPLIGCVWWEFDIPLFCGKRPPPRRLCLKSMRAPHCGAKFKFVRNSFPKPWASEPFPSLRDRKRARQFAVLESKHLRPVFSFSCGKSE